jgi:hypothetical protein
MRAREPALAVARARAPRSPTWLRRRVTVVAAVPFVLCATSCGGTVEDKAGPTRTYYGAAPDAGAPEAAADSTPAGPDACAPATCLSAAKDCGNAPDGCGSTMSCGSCPAGKVCGGDGPNRCGSAPCVPRTCKDQGAECGVVSDGCSTVLQCGSCPAPRICGAGGKPNACGCVPVACPAGAQCGSVNDGCGAPTSCGACPPNLACGTGAYGFLCIDPVGEWVVAAATCDGANALDAAVEVRVTVGGGAGLVRTMADQDCTMTALGTWALTPPNKLEIAWTQQECSVDGCMLGSAPNESPCQSVAVISPPDSWSCTVSFADPNQLDLKCLPKPSYCPSSGFTARLLRKGGKGA